MSNRIAPKLLVEFIGTFSLIFIGAGAAAVVGDGVGLPGIAAIALAHGLTVTAFAFAYGPVSGGHFNPSVTTAVLAAGAMRAGEAAGYIVSQLVGGLLGALLLRAVLGGAATGLGTPMLAHDLARGNTTLTVTSWAGFVIEAVLAFFLCTVVLSTAVAGRAQSRAACDRHDPDPQHQQWVGRSQAPLSTRRARSDRWSRPAISTMPGSTWLPRSLVPSSLPFCTQGSPGSSKNGFRRPNRAAPPGRPPNEFRYRLKLRDARENCAKVTQPALRSCCGSFVVEAIHNSRSITKRARSRRRAAACR
jgi:Major intrinsic protein